MDRLFQICPLPLVRSVSATTRLLTDSSAFAAMAKPRFPYGDGHAAQRLLAWLESRPAQP